MVDRECIHCIEWKTGMLILNGNMAQCDRGLTLVPCTLSWSELVHWFGGSAIKNCPHQLVKSMMATFPRVRGPFCFEC